MKLQRGFLNLRDLEMFYRFIQKGRVPTATEEDLIKKIALDLLCSLINIKKWFSSFNKENVATSLDRFINMIKRAKEIDDIIIAIDTVINAYHEMGAFLENLINANFKDIVVFLNARREWS